MNLICFINVLYCFFIVAQGQAEDKRCRCICPSPAVVFDSSITTSDLKLFIANVAPNKCDCDNVILPRVSEEIKGHELEYCPRCQCKYESRNTTVIKVVVVMVIWVLTLLIGYMGFLMCLYPFMYRRKMKVYKEIGTEEVQNLLENEED